MRNRIHFFYGRDIIVLEKYMKQPKKWRDGINPFSIKFKNFKLLKILGYPYAGNDVFYCKGEIDKKNTFCFLKVARQKDNNIKNEVNVLTKIKYKYLPKIIEYDEENFSYIITKKMTGKRLSVIVGDNKLKQSLNYMFEFGKNLAKIHDLKICTEKAKYRKFFDIPCEEYCNRYQFGYVRDWLIKNKPRTQDLCFCHGDFHYANLLWNKGKISGILDWEMAGINIREYDVAWSLILRPGQKFMNTEREMKCFIEGYESIHQINAKYVKYYMVQIYLYFNEIGQGDKKYQNYIAKFFTKNCV